MTSMPELHRVSISTFKIFQHYCMTYGAGVSISTCILHNDIQYMACLHAITVLSSLTLLVNKTWHSTMHHAPISQTRVNAPKTKKTSIFIFYSTTKLPHFKSLPAKLKWTRRCCSKVKQGLISNWVKAAASASKLKTFILLRPLGEYQSNLTGTWCWLFCVPERKRQFGFEK